MIKLIEDNNKVHYGCIDEPIQWNYEDFILRDFFNKEIKGRKKKKAYHQFNYIGITAGQYVIGFAVADLGILNNVFSFLYDKESGVVFESDDKCLGNSKKITFPRNPDEHITRFKSGKTNLQIEKNHKKGILNFNCTFNGRLKVKGAFPFSIEKQKPLRVINPSVPTRFTFTEKCSPLTPTSFEASLDGKKLSFSKQEVSAIYDWTGGYLRKETNWYWAAMGAVLPDRTRIGANLAAFVNETYYSENAIWVNNTRTRIPRVIYDCDPMNPYEPWHIYDEEGILDLKFVPAGERSDDINGGPLIKMLFRQYIGVFEGFFQLPNSKKIEFKDISGFCEIQKAVW